MPANGNSIDPSINFVAVTKSDTVNIKFEGKPARSKGIYVGTTGDIALMNDQGDSIVFVGVPAGAVLPISTERVFSTSTTASDIVALF